MRAVASSKWPTRIAVSLILTILFAVGGKLWFFPGRSFDRQDWDSDVEGEGARLKMADRLVARRTLVGRSRREVCDMLGEPPRTGYFHNWDLVYWLGPERGFIGIDSEWMVLRCDSSGIVVDCRIVTD